MNYIFKKYINIVFNGLLVRDWMAWGTRGRSGKEPLKFVLLKDMTDEHIEAVLETQDHISNFYRNEFKNELKFRKKHKEFSIKDNEY